MFFFSLARSSNNQTPIFTILLSERREMKYQRWNKGGDQNSGVGRGKRLGKKCAILTLFGVLMLSVMEGED